MGATLRFYGALAVLLPLGAFLLALPEPGQLPDPVAATSKPTIYDKEAEKVANEVPPAAEHRRRGIWHFVGTPDWVDYWYESLSNHEELIRLPGKWVDYRQTGKLASFLLGVGSALVVTTIWAAALWRKSDFAKFGNLGLGFGLGGGLLLCGLILLCCA